MQMPPSVPEEFAPDIGGARAAVAEALAAGARHAVAAPGARRLLLAYGIESGEYRPAGKHRRGDRGGRRDRLPG